LARKTRSLGGFPGHRLIPGLFWTAVTWNNRIVGDARGDSGLKVTRTNIAGKFSRNSPLLPSGLLGPVILRSPVSATCELK